MKPSTTLLFLLLCLSIFANRPDSLIESSYDLDTEDALELLLTEPSLDQIDEPSLRASYYLALSSHYLDAGSVDKAIEVALSALQEAKALKDDALLIKTYNCTGECYRIISDFENSLEYFDAAIELAKTDSSWLPRLLNNSAISLSQLGEFEAANARLNRALEIVNVKQDNFGRARILNNLGFIHNQAGYHRKALDFFEQSLIIKKVLGNKKSLAYTLNDLGETHGFLGNYNRGIALSKQALRLAEEENAVYYMRDIYHTLSNSYDSLKNADSALYYFRLAYALSDSLINVDKAREIARAERIQELQEKDLQNTLLLAENTLFQERSRQLWVWLLFLLIITFTLGSLGYVLYRSNRNRKFLLTEIEHQNELLSEKNRESSRMLNEQDSLFNIVTHDLRGPLGNMVKLLKLESEETDLASRQDLRFMLETSAAGALQFIEDFNMIHRLEKNNEVPAKEEFDLTSLIHEVLGDFKGHIKVKELNIHFSAPSQFVTSVKGYVRHILFNLLSNAVKYSPQKGDIFINVLQKDSTRISIEDHGPGIEPGLNERIFERFYRGSEMELEGVKSSGLGLALVKLLVTKMNGRIKLRSKPGKGSEFIVYLS